MNENEIDEVLKAARVAPGQKPAPDPEGLKRITESIHATLRPVRPLPRASVLTVGLVLICVSVAIAGGARAGLDGVAKMNLWERVLIFSTLGIFLFIAGNELVHAMIPGSRRRISAGTLLGVGTLALVGVFALSFREYQTSHFVAAGVVCLAIGLLHAIPAALLGALLLRRGFAVNPIAAGSIAGALAGLAGLGVLELHCPNFQAAHVLVWHTAVVPLSAAAGALFAWVQRLLLSTSR